MTPRTHIQIAAALAALALAACGSSAPVDAVDAPPPGGGTGGGGTLTCEGSVAGRKQPFYGDLHVHTSYSLDAYTFNALNGPREAYRFAKGEPAGLPGGNSDPYTQAATTQLDRPLDFTAVTDHAEFLGGWYYACEGGPLGLPQGANPACEALGDIIRGNIRAVISGSAPIQVQLLRSLTADQPTSVPAWRDEQRIADEEYEPCAFTTIKAYEYTAARGTQQIHRNVFFLGDSLPLDVFASNSPDYPPVSNRNVNDDWILFDHLKTACNDRDDCEAFTIPHNPNLSAGRMFLPREPGTGVPIGRHGAPMTADDARLRASMDRAVEIAQHKGSSECSPGLGMDRLRGEENACDLELIKNVCRGTPTDPPGCAQYCRGEPDDPAFCHLRDVPAYAVDVCEQVGPNVTSGPGANCTAPTDMVRNALSEGLAIKPFLDGVNPYKLAIVAATDTHNGTPGNVEEKGWPGHGGLLDNDPRERLGAWFCDSASEDPNDPQNCSNRVFLDYFRAFSPGGITGVWAEENTRQQIWHGIHRGETFGTSGPRMRIRTIATWERPPADICARLASGENPVESGALAGARMGGDLPPGSGAPWVVAWAMQDPGGSEPGRPLQRLDLIKGTVDVAGEPVVEVFAGVAASTAPVLPPSRTDCSVDPGLHPEQLCAVWQDPAFDPARDAFYYARALEVPSCRYDAHLCTARGVDCALLDPANGVFPEASGLRGYEGCCLIEGTPGSFHGQNSFHTITERAWASPIWYAPTAP